MYATTAVFAKNADATNGYIALKPGYSNTFTGFIEFFSPGGNRMGFIGNGSSLQFQFIIEEEREILFATSNSGRMWIKADGKVGIWTSVPRAPLEVYGNVIIDNGNLNMSSIGRINNLVDPSAAQDAATKNYVDNLNPNVTRDDTSGAWHALTFIPVSYISSTNLTTFRGPLTVSRLGGDQAGLCYNPYIQTLASPKISTNNFTVNSNVQAVTTKFNLLNPGHLGINASNNSSQPYTVSQIVFGNDYWGPWINAVMEPGQATDGYRLDLCTGNHYINNPPLQIPRISIHSQYTGSGRVGIATTTPLMQLDVAGVAGARSGMKLGSYTSGSMTGDSLLDIEHPSLARSRYKTSNTTLTIGMGWNDGAGWAGEAFFWTETNTRIVFGTNELYRMTIAANGNVGIGTTAPTAKLEVAGNVKINSGSNDSRTSYIVGSSDFAVGIQDSDTLRSAFIWNHSNTPIIFATNGSERLRITADGNLNMNSIGRINNLVNPSAGQDAATKNYVDTTIGFSGSSGILVAPTVRRDDSSDHYHSLALIRVDEIGSGDTRTVLRAARGGTYGGPTYVPSTNTLASQNIASAYVNATTVQATTLTVDSTVRASTTFLNLTNPGHLGINNGNESGIPYVSSQITLGSPTYGPWIRTVMPLGGLTDNYRFEICNYTYGATDPKTPVLTIPQWSPRVGINTTTPQATLEVAGDIRISGGGYKALDIMSSTDARTRYYVGSNEFTVGAGANAFVWNHANTRIAFATNGAERMTIAANGYVGINTTAPDYPLHINNIYVYRAWTASPGSAYLVYYNSYRENGEQWYTAFYADYFVVSNRGFGVNSDERVKYNVRELDDSEALSDLRQLKPCKYRKYDSENINEEYGFIAQEVKSVLSDAVFTNTNFIYNFNCFCNVTKIYEDTDNNIYLISYLDKSNFSDKDISIPGNIADSFIFQGYRDIYGNEYKTSNGLPATDSSGNQKFRVRIVSFKTFEKCECDVIEIIDNYSFKVKIKKEKIIEDIEYYIVGQEVNDFNVLNKDVIWTVATAALQEVDRQQQADKARIAELEATVAAQQLLINDILERLKKVGA
jgi:hypothetical protein